MLGLGLRSSQSPGVSGSAPQSATGVVTTLIGESFDAGTNLALSPNPYGSGGQVARGLTGWAQGYECVAGVTPIAGNPSSAEGWGTMVLSDGGTYNAQAIGWAIESLATVSSQTGPDSAPVSRDDNNINPSSTTNDRYLYSETSSNISSYNNANRLFIARSPGVNFSQSMASQSNSIRVSFQIHGFGTKIGEFRLYVDDAATSTQADCAEVFTMSEFSQVSSGSAWSPVSFTLNSVNLPDLGQTDLRTTDSTFYFYLVHEPDPLGPTPYTGDLAIDNFYIEEIG